MPKFSFLALVFVFTLLSGCKSQPLSSAPPSTSQVYLMTYNVENLFDTKDDPTKTDETFLPLSKKQTKKHKKDCNKIKQDHWRQQCLEWDWDDEVLHTKMLRLSKVVRQVEDGRGPDVLFLQEVENKEVLKTWNQNYLADLGYKEVVLIEGKDKRGIDVAVLSRLPLTQPPQLHLVPYKGLKKRQLADTRGILEAHFKLPDGTELATFTVHFPAPFHPVDLRLQSFNYLNQLLKQLPHRPLAVAAGDFNVPSEENKKFNLLDKHVGKLWLIAHQEGCSKCKGTNYYPPKKSWSFLDMILLSKSFEDTKTPWRLDTASIRLLNDVDFQKTVEGYPNRFELPETSGVSDHWPLGLRLVKTTQ